MMISPQLETFVRAAELGSFSQAAEALGLSTPAVIKQMNALENALGLLLFERTHRGIRLTAAGASLLDDARYLIGYAAQSLDRARAAERKPERRLRIGTSLLTPSSFILRLWPKLPKALQSIRIELVPYENTPENAREILLNLGRNIDVVPGVYDETLLRLRDCRAVKLGESVLGLALPRSHPLAKRAAVTPQDLAGETVRLIRPGWSRATDQLRGLLSRPGIRLETFDTYRIEEFNRSASDGICLAAFELWKDVHPMLKFVPFSPDIRLNYGLLHAHNPSVLVREFLCAAVSIKTI